MKLFSVISPPKSEFDVTVHEILQGSQYAHLKNALSDFIASVFARPGTPSRRM